MSNLQLRIKKVRTEHGMSVEDVAKKLAENGVKISARTIYSYELNERQPSVMYLQALVDYLEVNPEWLLSGRGEVFHQKQPQPICLQMLIYRKWYFCH